MSVASILREETRREHDRTEAAFASFDLSAHEGYALFLSAQASAFLAVEQALESAGVASKINDWSSRRRSELLLQDLQEAGLGKVRLQPRLKFGDEAQLLGGVYVLEGSRLGGKVLRSRVPLGAPVRFLDAEGAQGAWRTFRQSLDWKLKSQLEIDQAVVSARRVFRSFEKAGRDALELGVGR